MSKNSLGPTNFVKPITRFLKTVKKKQRSAVIPLEHGHLTNATVYESKNVEPANKPAIWRGKKIERSEHVARVQAFQQARRVATQTAKERVEKDFRTKSSDWCEAAPWDAKVRIFQTRKKRKVCPGRRGREVDDGERRCGGYRSAIDLTRWSRAGLSTHWCESERPRCSPTVDVRSLHQSTCLASF